jgi:hypothetical protein
MTQDAIDWRDQATCGPLAALEVVLHKTALNLGPVLLTHFWSLAIR